jgi:hypothetical protein
MAIDVKIFHAQGLTGGGDALDGYATSALDDDDFCFTFDSSKFYVHYFDESATDAESSPTVIRPNDYSTSGVWKLLGSPYGDLQVQCEVVSGLAMEGNITGGNVTVSGNTLTITPTTCLDSGLTTKLYTSANATCVIPSAANTEYFVFLVKLVSGGTFEFRAYATLAGVASDAQVSKYRLITWCKTDGSSVVMPYIQNGQELEFSGANKPQITATLTTGYVSYAVSTVASVLAESITYQTYAGGANTVSFSLDGTNSIGNTAHTGNRMTTVKTANIYMLRDNADGPVKIAGMRIRR